MVTFDRSAVTVSIAGHKIGGFAADRIFTKTATTLEIPLQASSDAVPALLEVVGHALELSVKYDGALKALEFDEKMRLVDYEVVVGADFPVVIFKFIKIEKKVSL